MAPAAPVAGALLVLAGGEIQPRFTISYPARPLDRAGRRMGEDRAHAERAEVIVGIGLQGMDRGDRGLRDPGEQPIACFSFIGR